MYAVFFHERYEPGGGAFDLFGKVESIEPEALTPIIMEFIIERIVSRNDTDSEYFRRLFNYDAQIYVTTMNLETLEVHSGFLAIWNSGRNIELSSNDQDNYLDRFSVQSLVQTTHTLMG